MKRLVSMKKAFALCTVVLAMAACSDRTSRDDDAGTVKGELIRVGGPAPGAPVPLKGTVRFQSGQRVVNVTVGRTGRFEVRLPAGRYTVEGTSSQIQGGSGPCSAPVDVDVSAGEVQEQRVICHIR